MLVMSSGLLFVSLLLFRDWVLPIIQCLTLDYCINNKKIEKKIMIVLSFILMTIAVILNTVFIEYFILHGTMIGFHCAYRIMWIVVCYFLIVCRSVFYRKFSSVKWGKILFFAEAVVVLLNIAFPRCFIIPFFELVTGYPIVGDREILLFLTLIFAISTYSYLFGKTITSEKSFLKLGVGY